MFQFQIELEVIQIFWSCPYRRDSLFIRATAVVFLQHISYIYAVELLIGHLQVAGSNRSISHKFSCFTIIVNTYFFY